MKARAKMDRRTTHGRQLYSGRAYVLTENLTVPDVVGVYTIGDRTFLGNAPRDWFGTFEPGWAL